MTMTEADRYRALSQRFTDLLAAVPVDRRTAPSPCEGWTIDDIVTHVVTTELEFLERLSFEPTSKPDTTDPYAAWPIIRAHVQALLDDPDRAGTVFDGYFGPTTFAATVDTFYSTDLTVHAWDIARAAGLARSEPVAQVEIDRVMTAFGPESKMAAAMRQPGLFSDPTPTVDDADPTTRLMAWLGRQT